MRRYRRRLLAAAVMGLVAGLVALLPYVRDFELRGIDFLLPARHLAFGPLFPPSRSDVVVVAIDEQSYRTEPFANTPKVAWTPHFGAVIDAVNAAGPMVPTCGAKAVRPVRHGPTCRRRCGR